MLLYCSNYLMSTSNVSLVTSTKNHLPTISFHYILQLSIVFLSLVKIMEYALKKTIVRATNVIVLQIFLAPIVKLVMNKH